MRLCTEPRPASVTRLTALCLPAFEIRCVFDFCATDGDPAVKDMTDFIRMLDSIEALNRPPSMPPPPPVLEMQPAQCVTTADGVTHCVHIPVNSTLSDPWVQRAAKRRFGSELS